MFIILKKISIATRVADIEDFISPALRGGLFNKTGRIAGIVIEMILPADSDLAEYHAIVKIEPEIAALRVIRTLNRKRCNGKPINVSGYFFRQRVNDRRDDGASAPELDRRTSERRRKGLIITDITAEKKGFKVELNILNPAP